MFSASSSGFPPSVCFYVLVRAKRGKARNWAAFIFLSVSACAASLSFQIQNIGRLVEIEDWSALMDTMGTVVFASEVLLTGTLLLNSAAFFTLKGRGGENWT